MATMGKIDRRHRPRRRARDLLRDDSGATIVEFAMVAAPFFALILAILMTSVIFLAQQALETAAEASARLVTTGQAQQGGWTAAQYKAQACTKLPPILNCNKLIVDVETVSSFSAASTSPPTITYDANGNPTMPYQTGGAGAIVIVRLLYIWPIATGPLGFNLSNQSGSNSRLLMATSVSQTEPYSS